MYINESWVVKIQSKKYIFIIDFAYSVEGSHPIILS